MSRQVLIKALDTVVSKIVRLRDTNCITCGRNLKYETAECGHFQKRDNMATRWHLENCNAQCHKCNSEDDTDRYEIAMISKYGPAVTEEIKRLARSEVHVSITDLRELLTQFNKLYNLYKINQ